MPQIIAFHRFGAKPLSKQTLNYSTKMNVKMSIAKWRHFCLGLNVLSLYGLILLNQKESMNLGMSVTIHCAVGKTPSVDRMAISPYCLKAKHTITKCHSSASCLRDTIHLDETE